MSELLYCAPRDLDENLLKKAAEGEVLRPVLVGAASREALQTAASAQDYAIAETCLVGNRQDFLFVAEQLGVAAERFRFVEADSEPEMIQKATALVRTGEANCLIKGQIHTDVYMRGILDRQYGVREETARRLVHVFALIPPQGGKPLFVSDGAVNPTPDIETLQQSVISSIALARAWGLARPKVALLSATESIIPSVPSSTQAHELKEWALAQNFHADIAGPLALDGAISPEAARIKGLDDGVAGQADILIVPDIVSGNILFKSAVWFAGAYAAGVVLGAQVPIVLTSRADPAEARLASIALAKLASQYAGDEPSVAS